MHIHFTFHVESKCIVFFLNYRLNELPKPSVVYELRTESPVPGGNWSAATTLDESVPEFLSPYAIQAVEGVKTMIILTLSCAYFFF